MNQVNRPQLGDVVRIPRGLLVVVGTQHDSQANEWSVYGSMVGALCTPAAEAGWVGARLQDVQPATDADLEKAAELCGLQVEQLTLVNGSIVCDVGWTRLMVRIPPRPLVSNVGNGCGA